MYLHLWKETGFAGMCEEFDGERWEYESKSDDPTKSEKFAGLDILLASYGYDNYAGDAFVLFKRDGKLYEVNGSHCSCYGLEGQWEPEETNKEALEKRLTDGSLGKDEWTGNEFADELREALAKL